MWIETQLRADRTNCFPRVQTNSVDVFRIMKYVWDNVQESNYLKHRVQLYTTGL